MTDREKFAEDNIGLIYGFLDKYHIRYKMDEILDILYIGYTKALNIYDKEKGSFSTIAFECMEKEYFHYIKYWKSNLRDVTKVVSLNTNVGEDGEEELIDFVKSNDDVDKTVEEKRMLNYIRDLAPEVLTKREQLVFYLYFYKEVPIKDIAKYMGISKQMICAYRDKAVNKLQYYFRGDPDFEEPKMSVENAMKDMLCD